MADVNLEIELDSSGAQKSIDALGESFSKLGSIAVAVGASIAAAFAGKKILEAAIESDNAINKLNTSLSNSGRYSKEASLSFQAFADQLQKTAGIQDETVLSLVSLATVYTKTNEQTKQLTKAAIELSAATGKDLDSSIQALGKSLSGHSTELSRQLPIYKQFSESQLRAGAAIEFTLSRFGGSAEAQTKTFAGAVNLLKLNFDDLLESLGKVVTQNPAIRGAILETAKIFGEFGDKFKSLKDNTDLLQQIAHGFVVVGSTISQFFLGPIELISHLLGGVAADLGVLSVAFQQFISGDFKKAWETIKNTPIESKDIIKVDVADNVESAFKRIDNAILNSKGKIEEFHQNIDQISGPIGISFKNIADAWNVASLKMTVTADTLAQTFRNSFVSGISNAFAAFGNALARGGNAFENFGKSILNTIGALAIQLGQFFLLVGFGMTATGPLLGLSGGEAVAAGIGLIVLGGVLQGLAGGGQSTPGVAGGATSPSATEAPQAPDVKEKTTAVTINVEGTVLSPREVGLQIAQILNDTFDSNDTRVVASA
jgi:hypothetical protein